MRFYDIGGYEIDVQDPSFYISENQKNSINNLIDEILNVYSNFIMLNYDLLFEL